jgi:N-acetylglucosaminyl-diphospho-decaprenol L-rhamnosyltransferase
VKRVAVVVITWNSEALLPGLVASLAEGLAGTTAQVIVVDNDSADGTLGLATKLLPDGLVLSTGHNAGYSAAFNVGVAAADPFDAALILNPDIRLGPGSIATLFEALGDDVGITVPRIRNEDGSTARSLRREPTIPRAVGMAVLGQRAGRWPVLGEEIVNDDAYERVADVDWATGAAMLISATCLQACGPWQESFFLYSEETEYALRARDHGFHTRYVPDATVTHLGGESRVSPALWGLLTANRVRLYRQRHSAAAGAMFWSAVFAQEAARAALGKARSRRAVGALLRPSTADPR